MLNRAVRHEYARMRAAGIGEVVGEAALTCMRLARARAEALERDDVLIAWYSEQENYADVYGEQPPEGSEFACCVVLIDGQHYASLGFVETSNHEYVRMVENELLAEAFVNERDRDFAPTYRSGDTLVRYRRSRAALSAKHR